MFSWIFCGWFKTLWSVKVWFKNSLGFIFPALKQRFSNCSGRDSQKTSRKTEKNTLYKRLKRRTDHNLIWICAVLWRVKLQKQDFSVYSPCVEYQRKWFKWCHKAVDYWLLIVNLRFSLSSLMWVDYKSNPMH